MFFVRAAFWIFLILLLMPTNDKEKSDFYTAASRTISDLGAFCTRNPQVCESTGSIFETILRKMRTTVEMLEEMVQPTSQPNQDTGSLPRERQGGQRPQRGARGDMLVTPTPARSQHTLRPDDLQPTWRGPGRV
jgi:hypothetical protein